MNRFMHHLMLLLGLVRQAAMSNDLMVAHLFKTKVISEHIADAMRDVDRANYMPSEFKGDAYASHPQLIGYNVTISAPYMHGHCLELLKENLKPGARVLDVGSGSGYLTAVMGKLVSPNGCAIGIEHISELVEISEHNVKKGNADLLKNGVVRFVQGDGREGFPQSAPYDCIHVGAASAAVPAALVDQLKPGGRIAIPIGRQDSFSGQKLMVYEKDQDGKVSSRVAHSGVIYVPLTGVQQQLRSD
jgi:protein-L-isoaspartate(D-aspartate) O-methyltransferase